MDSIKSSVYLVYIPTYNKLANIKINNMKRIFKILLLIMVLGQTFNVKAQDKIKKYSFTVYVSNGTASSSCLKIKKAYVSPIVSFQFDDYRIGDSQDVKGSKLHMKWAKKCQAKFNIQNTYCWGNRKQVWEKSRSEVDEERDKVITELRRQGYSVTENYSFSFYFN